MDEGFECGMQLFQYVKKMPKVELHAHLNGSFTARTLEKMLHPEVHQSSVVPPSFDKNDVFQRFSVIHTIVNSPEKVYMGTCDVIEEFYDDGVNYLELRTTPKADGSFKTQDAYVETVMKAIQDTCSEKCKGMYVKLLLSIDRGRTIEAARETLKIAEKYFTSNSSVIGIDFSGNPKNGDVSSFIPLMEYAKRVGLKLAVHVAEIPGLNAETNKLLELEPDRLGHGTHLHPSRGGSQENFDLLKRLHIPLEFCLTSNVDTKTVLSFEDHHYKLFKELNYPCTLGTDDKGVFNTNLSNEYCLASEFYSLSRKDLENMALSSIDYIFCNDIKSELKQNFKEKMQQ